MAMMAGLGLVMKMTSQLVSGFQDAQAAEYNAERSMENARLTRKQSQEDARMQRVFSMKTLSNMKTDFGARGIRFEGSARDVYEASAAEAENDYQKILQEGEAKASGFENDAGLYKSQAASAPWTGAVSAAGTLFGGGADWKSKYA